MGESPSSQPTIQVSSPKPGAALVVLGGEHDLHSSERLQQTFDSVFGSEHLIVDLSTAEFIDSTIIGVLIQTKNRAEGLGRRFTVVLGTAPIVERILDVSGVRPVFNVVPTVEQALAA